MEKERAVAQMKVISQFRLVVTLLAHEPLAGAEKQQGETNRLFTETEESRGGRWEGEKEGGMERGRGLEGRHEGPL